MSRFEELPLDSPMVVVTRLPPIELWCTAPASGTPRSVSLTKAPMTQATFAGVCAYQPPQERRLPKRNVTHGMGKLTDNRSVRCPPPGMPKRFGSNVVEEYHSQHWLVKSNLVKSGRMSNLAEMQNRPCLPVLFAASVETRIGLNHACQNVLGFLLTLSLANVQCGSSNENRVAGSKR